MDDKATQMIRSAVRKYMEEANMDGFVVDAILTFTLMAKDGVNELIVASTSSPIWTLRGMMAEAEDMILAAPYFSEYGEDEE